MKYDKEFKYTYINKTVFDNKYLECKNDGSKYKKYILVYYKDNNKIKYTEIPNELYLNRFKDIINTYEVEEIISTCIHFDDMYNKLYYFHIKDSYFIKYQTDEETIKLLGLNDDSKEIKKLIDKLI